MAAFADCVTVILSLVSLVVGSETFIMHTCTCTWVEVSVVKKVCLLCGSNIVQYKFLCDLIFPGIIHINKTPVYNSIVRNLTRKMFDYFGASLNERTPMVHATQTTHE